MSEGKRAQAALNGLARANGWPEAEAYNYPASVFHVVQPGETLYGLTARYETSVAGIIAANGGDDSLSLVAGMTLIIPKPRQRIRLAQRLIQLIHGSKFKTGIA